MAVSSLRAFTMPKWGIEMVEGMVAEWHVEPGASFSKGDLLVGIETDKIVNEVEAEFASVCLTQLVEEGDTVPVGDLLAVFGDAGTSADDVDRFVREFVPAGSAAPTSAVEASPPATPGAPAEPASTAAPATAQEPSPGAETLLPDDGTISPRAREALRQGQMDAADIHGSGRDGRIQLQDVLRAGLAPAGGGPAVENSVDLSDFADINATDVAKRVAQSLGQDLHQVTGSGRDGRIRLSDLGSTPASGGQIAQAAPVADSRRVPFSNMRKQIARRLTTSYQTIPHYYLQSDVFVDSLMQARAAFNAAAPVKSSLNDWLVRAVALTLAEHPAINVHVEDDATTSFADANVAVAVAIDGGLITPVVKRAQNLSLAQIQQHVGELVTRARSGTLQNDDVAGGTFTMSNLGMFGISRFTALINPPQGAILSVGAARPVATQRDGAIVFASQLSLTLGCDHRAIDGAIGGAFLKDLSARLENPATLL